MSFPAKSVTVCLWLFVAVLGVGWTKVVPSNSGATGIIRLRRQSSSSSATCVVPPQPTHGQWKLYKTYCNSREDCNIPQGLSTQSGTRLVYTCDPGYIVNTDSEVYCTALGTWSVIANCIEMKCGILDSPSRTAICNYGDAGVACNVSVLPETRAYVTCRPGYKRDPRSSVEQSEIVTCNTHGKWVPDPIECLRAAPSRSESNRDTINSYPQENVNIPTDSISQFGNPPFIGSPTSSPTPFCPAPPQPANGEWKIHPDFCDRNHINCQVPEGTELLVGCQLIISCVTEYRAEGNGIVYCKRDGDWTHIPSCVRSTCETLNSESRNAHCTHPQMIASCDFPVLPWTQAELSCRPGYRADKTGFVQRRKFLTCNANGTWEPAPFRCLPVCGQATNQGKPLIVNGKNATVGEFPWHASLYKQNSYETKIDFICGATIIQNDLLMTAGHCVYDEKFQTKEDPRKLFVMTGNVFRDWEDERHDENIVKKNKVKQVYLHYTYYGLQGNYAADIALIELERPFVFSEILLPACLDATGDGAPFLDPGVQGRIAGFGRTATGKASPTLQTITVPYVSYTQCRASKHAIKNEVFITNDKFCAGYTNGSVVCEGDSGGGLVFQKHELWYVLGIASVGLGVNVEDGSTTCEKYSYTLYTKVTAYTNWILETMADVKKRKQSSLTTPEPTGNHRETSQFTYTQTMRTPTTISSPAPRVTVLNEKRQTFCSVPSQPTNGEWNPRESRCLRSGSENVDCYIYEGMKLAPESHLAYSCDPGYTAAGSSYVYCTPEGTWTNIPECVEIKCSDSNFTSGIADCVSQSKRDTTSETTSKETELCNVKGCTPVCGRPLAHQTTLVINGISVKIGEFPWHASVYHQQYTTQGSKKEFVCGATLIRANLLLTAAHCVYDETTKATIEPAELFVMMGNVVRDYDSPLHNKQTVRKSVVKNVYRNCQYVGRADNYASDIALLELQESFQFSETLLPVCLDVEGDSVEYPDGGAFGKISGFGKLIVNGPSNGILQTTTVPYIPYNQCKRIHAGTRDEAFIGHDKFCTSHINGTAICEGDHGSGLVFKKNDLWYVLGVASVDLDVDDDDGSEKTCDRFFYSLYTSVSNHRTWIRLVMSGLKERGYYPPCYPHRDA